MMPIKNIIGVFIALLVIFGVWLVYWPLMEGFYAWSLTPIISKLESFILGILIMVAGAMAGVKVLN